jgi:hypothetical protein
MSTQPIGAVGQMYAVAALAVVQGTQAGTAAVQTALDQTAGGTVAPVVSSSVTAPGSLELFA